MGSSFVIMSEAQAKRNDSGSLKIGYVLSQASRDGIIASDFVLLMMTILVPPSSRALIFAFYYLSIELKRRRLLLMLKNFIKNWLKKSQGLHNFLIWLIHTYLFLVYKTTRLRCILPSGYNLEAFDNETKTIFVMWHGMLALALKIDFNKRIKVLASSHTDGRIISGVLAGFGYSIIEGSTNRAPIAATRQIIRALHNNDNIFITPDGPRGPARKLNSNVVGIAKMTGAKIIPMSFAASHFFRLGTWDRLNMPLPFGSITFKLGEPMRLSDNDALCSLELEERLNELSK